MTRCCYFCPGEYSFRTEKPLAGDLQTSRGAVEPLPWVPRAQGLAGDGCPKLLPSSCHTGVKLWPAQATPTGLLVPLHPLWVTQVFLNLASFWASFKCRRKRQSRQAAEVFSPYKQSPWPQWDAIAHQEGLASAKLQGEDLTPKSFNALKT